MKMAIDRMLEESRAGVTARPNEQHSDHKKPTGAKRSNYANFEISLVVAG